MKKKDKNKKKEDMPEFTFKEFTTDEDRIYSEAIDKFREAIEKGKTLREAYESYSVEDKEFEKLIQADFLKILIAERHFGEGKTLDDVAGSLGIPVAVVKETHARMLQEVGITAANQFGQEFGGIVEKTDD
jgi:hypothetical protein